MRVRPVQPENDEWTLLKITDNAGILITVLASATSADLI